MTVDTQILPWLRPLFPFALSGNPVATAEESVPQWVFTTYSQVDWEAQVWHNIFEIYEMPHPDVVFRFLSRHSFLAEVVLGAAYILLHFIFGPGTHLSLELIRDVETGDEELFALVQVNIPVEEAVEKLRAFDEGWFLDQQDMVKGLFNVDVVFS